MTDTAERDHELDAARGQSLYFRYMLTDSICQTFAISELRSKPDRGLLVNFRDGHDHREVALLLHAPMNYVGVYTRDNANLRWTFGLEGDWQVIAYHDSCWRHDGVGQVIREHVTGMGHPMLIDMRIVNVHESDQAMLRDVRRRRD
jgi:hypothetical protein